MELDIKDFLLSYEISNKISRADIEDEIKEMTKVMRDGSLENPSSIPMIPTHITIDDIQRSSLETSIVAMAIDIGGTNTRISTIRKDEHGHLIVSLHKVFPTPGKDHDISTHCFCNAIADQATEFMNAISYVGICFSFASKQDEHFGATVIAGGKQIKFTDIIGKCIDKELAIAFKEHGIKRELYISVINDASAVLLGVAACFPSTSTLYIGVILGTGFNISYTDPAKQCIVNTEVGGYRGFPVNSIDQQLFFSTIDPDIDWCEKMVSGEYLGKLCTFYLLTAAKEGYIKLNRIFTEQNALLSEDISGILEKGVQSPLLNKLCSDKQNCLNVISIIESIVDRAAFFVASSVAATMVFCGSCEKYNKFKICVEGSLYKHLFSFNKRVSNWLTIITDAYPSIHYEITDIPNSTLIGAYQLSNIQMLHSL